MGAFTTRSGTPRLLLASLLLLAARVASAHDWNDAQIQWQSYEAGLAQAKSSKKPVCLIFFTEWCPHCKNYSGVFHDPKVVEKAKQFVMIHLNSDENKELGAQYGPDGQYIPRTFFLSSEGKLDPDLTAGRPNFKYFYDEKDPASILAGMDGALRKFK
ncbi:MAG TPA: thioredoxin family protein [Candidatus Binatia bacterium]|nr:thioredoxin family protein [Candidatus Binatia bacterium]